jgi:DNA-binding winged helix-turn-helix (wHTH) protein
MIETPRVYSFGPFRLDTTRRVLERVGQEGSATVELTNMEYDLLHAIVFAVWSSPEKKVTDGQLFERVWPHQKEIGPEDNRLSVHTGRINKKLGTPYIKRNQREGYVLTLKVEDCTPADSRMLVTVRILFVCILATIAAVTMTMTIRAVLAGYHATLTQASDAGAVLGWFQGVIGSLVESLFIAGGLAYLWFAVLRCRPWRSRYPKVLAAASGAVFGFLGGLINSLALTYAQELESLQRADWIVAVDPSTRLRAAFYTTGMGWAMPFFGLVVGAACGFTTIWIVNGPEWKDILAGHPKLTNLADTWRVFVSIARHAGRMGCRSILLPMAAAGVLFDLGLLLLRHIPARLLIRTAGDCINFTLGGLSVVVGILYGLYILTKGIDIAGEQICSLAPPDDTSDAPRSL